MPSRERERDKSSSSSPLSSRASTETRLVIIVFSRARFTFSFCSLKNSLFSVLYQHALLRRLFGRRPLPPRAPQAVVQVGDHRPGQAVVQPGKKREEERDRKQSIISQSHQKINQSLILLPFLLSPAPPHTQHFNRASSAPWRCSPVG